MAQRGTRRLRLIAAMTIAGIAGLAGGALPTVLADDATPPSASTDATATQCPATTGDQTGAAVTTPGTGTSTDPCTTEPPPPNQPPVTTAPPTDTTPATTAPPTGTTPANTTPAAPAPPTTQAPAAPAPQTQTGQSTPPPVSAPAASKPTVTGHEQQHAGTPTAAHPRPSDIREHHATPPRPPVHGAAPAVQPLHPSPYAGLTMHWTMPDPLGLDTFPKITVAEFPVPPFLLPIYEAAGAQYRIHWQILAAINEVETGFGRNLRESSAGAVGWMQFLPSTWQRYGVDADGDGRRDPWDPVDAIFAAARYLHAAGAESSLPNAIFAYNHAGWYVDQVIERARTFAGLPDDLVAVLTRQGFAETASIREKLGKPSYLARGVRLTMSGQALLLDSRQLRRVVLHDARIHIYGCGRQDIADNRIDPRILATLEFLRLSKLDPTVSTLECGHSFLTRSGNVSEHSSGDAVDISAINGVPILGHQGPDSITDLVVRRLLRLQGLMDPHQIITLMTYAGQANTLALPDHADHVHVGFRPMAPGQ